MISNGRPLALCRGVPPMMQRLSGSIVAVRLCWSAASPAGVNGSLSAGRSLPMLPVIVPRMLFQYPLKSGCPSAVRGAGFEDFTSARDNSSCAKARGEQSAPTARVAKNAAVRCRDLIAVAPYRSRGARGSRKFQRLVLGRFQEFPVVLRLATSGTLGTLEPLERRAGLRIRGRPL